MVAVGRKIGVRDRTATKELRRRQLIDSTMASIAKRGFAETTMADVAQGARLSQGIVNYHFRSKDQLLVETLSLVTEEYRAAWMSAVEKAGPVAADRLAALLLAAFDPAICTRRKLAVWHAFYGEARSRPTYREICDAFDQERLSAVVELVRRIVAEGAHGGLDPLTIGRGLESLTDGLWLDLLLGTSRLQLEDARATVMAFLACVFPTHFPVETRQTTPPPGA
jgi:TetR/AcrR family transcriptional repressor of bet genes